MTLPSKEQEPFCQQIKSEEKLYGIGKEISTSKAYALVDSCLRRNDDKQSNVESSLLIVKSHNVLKDADMV